MKRWLCLPLVLLLASCSLFGKKKPKVVEDNRPQLVGRIASLPTGGGFALIEAYGAWKVPAGSVLTTTGAEGRAATLVSSGEKTSRFAVADIKAGTLIAGDGVYYQARKEAKETDGDESVTPKETAVPEVPGENSKNPDLEVSKS